MKRIAVLLLFGALPAGVKADECAQVRAALKLPVELKLEGKPRQARWGQVEKVLTRLREAVGDRPCRLTFEQVFSPRRREDVFFPLIYNLLRTAPEESLVGTSVYAASGRRLGTFSNRVTFTKQGERSYTHYYFQFKDREGKLQSGGSSFLIDTGTGKPFFLLSWDELKARTLIADK